MANKNKKNGTRNSKRGGPKAPRISTGLDEYGTRYAKLLADPCNAELTPSVFSGANGALLARFEYDQIFNSSATDVGSAGYFCPGALCQNTTNNAVGFGGPWSSDTIPGILVNATPAIQPGNSFLNANASGVRAISACIQVNYMGSELNRAGVIAVGCGKLSSITGTTTTAGLRTLAQVVQRMPDEPVEYRLPPTDASALFRDPTSTLSPLGEPTGQDLPALFWSATGIPVSTGVRVRFVVVYEWIPKVNTGMTIPNMGKVSHSRNSVEDVVRALEKTGDWLHRGVDTTYSMVGSAIRGARMATSVYNAGKAMMSVRGAAPLLLSL